MESKKKKYVVFDGIKQISVADLPLWIYKYDHGTYLPTGEMDMSVPERGATKVREWLKKNKIKFKEHITEY